VDSSVWIDFFSSAPGRAGDELRRMISDAESFALTGLVVAEILQASRRDASRIEHIFPVEMLEPTWLPNLPRCGGIFGWGAPKV